jgi:outer membrane protein
VDENLKSLSSSEFSTKSTSGSKIYGELNIENSNTNLKMTQASILPTLNLTGNISTNYNYNNGNYFSQLGNNFYLPIGLSLGIPIYNNRIYKTAIEKSKIEIEQANLDLLNTKTVLNQQLNSLY